MAVERAPDLGAPVKGDAEGRVEDAPHVVGAEAAPVPDREAVGAAGRREDVSIPHEAAAPGRTDARGAEPERLAPARPAAVVVAPHGHEPPDARQVDVAGPPRVGLEVAVADVREAEGATVHRDPV